MKRRVLVVFPTAWDERQFAALPPAVREQYELVFDEPRDADVRWDFDVLAYLALRARAWRGRLAGVFSSSDYPGAVAAAALAAELGLPGAPPASVLRAAHKFHAREVQRAVVPEVVPRFALFDPRDERTWPPEDAFPCFVKPVKGSFSLFARRIPDRGALARFAGAPALEEFRGYYLRLFEALAARYTRFGQRADAFLAEEVLAGEQVTVEGWIQGGRAHVLGIVDTSFHPGTQSFASFDYPSRLAPAVARRMERAACAVAVALGLDHTLFNVELFHDAERDRIGLIEVNPRLCGQFGDLYAKVDGTSGFQLALELCCGIEPSPQRAAGRHAAAASIPLRVFRSTRVRAVPDAERLRRAAALHPDTLVWGECHGGDELLVGPEIEDGASVRYGVVNLGGRDRADIRARLSAVERVLGYELEPLARAPDDR